MPAEPRQLPAGQVEPDQARKIREDVLSWPPMPADIRDQVALLLIPA